MKQIKNRHINGRPTLIEIDKKSYFARVRLTAEDYFLVKAKAREAGMNMSEYIRSALQKSEVRQRLSPEHNRLILSLTVMGNNLNQLAKRANQVGYLAVDLRVKKMINDLDEVIKMIENDG